MAASATGTPIANPSATERRTGARSSCAGSAAPVASAAVMPDRWYALRSLAVQRWLAVLVLTGLTCMACGGGGQSTSEQGRSIAETAGLAKDVADFFALATTGLTATYRVTLQTQDSSGQPLQLTTTQRLPDARFDAFHADGT